MGPDLSEFETSFPSNTVLFEFFDGFYLLESKEITSIEDHESQIITFDSDKVKSSYKYDTLVHLMDLQREIMRISSETQTMIVQADVKLQKPDKLIQKVSNFILIY